MVVDASVGAEWFRPQGDPDAIAIYRLIRTGRAIGIVSPIFLFEVLNVAGRRWRYSARQLEGIRGRITGPVAYTFPPSTVAWCRWIDAGLTSYDASYAALSEEFGIPMATTDRQMLDLVPTARDPRAVLGELV